MLMPECSTLSKKEHNTSDSQTSIGLSTFNSDNTRIFFNKRCTPTGSSLTFCLKILFSSCGLYCLALFSQQEKYIQICIALHSDSLLSYAELAPAQQMLNKSNIHLFRHRFSSFFIFPLEMIFTNPISITIKELVE